MGYWLGLLRDWGISLAIVLVAFGLYQWIATPTPVTEGPAPDFTLPTLDGGELSLADLGDGTAVLNFWFTDCGPCRHEIPELSAWAQAHPDVPLVGISTDRLPAPQVATRARQLGVRYPVAHDATGRVAQQYGVGVFPTTVVIRDGKIRSVRIGALNRQHLDELVQSAR